MAQIDRAVALYRAKLKELPPDKREAMEKACVLTFEEHFAYQTKQSQLFAMGRISFSTAQFIYRCLGGIYNPDNGGFASGVTLAEKCVVTRLVAEMMGVV